MYLNTKALFAALLLSTNAAIAVATTTQSDQLFMTHVGSYAPPAELGKLHTLRGAFLEWKDGHAKVYSSMEREVNRMMVWIENHEFIETHNAKSPTPNYTMGHNKFSDMTNDEFQKYHTLGKYSPGKKVMENKLKERQAMHKLNPNSAVQQELRYLTRKARNLEESLEEEQQEKLELFDDWFDDDENESTDDGSNDDAETDDEATDDIFGNDDTPTPDTDDAADTDDDDTDGLPEEIDWVEAGAVTPVKDQGQCGSCWAFSSTGAIEGAHFVVTGELASLSEQNIMDCDPTDSSCEGGLMENAFKFEESQKGLCSEDDYPYLAVDSNECNTDCTKVAHSRVKSYTDITPGDKHALMASIIMQPTSIAMDAGALAFQFYSGGVFTDNGCGADGSIDHGVLAVGYGTDDDSGLTYFKVKNSWGDSWGEDGYFRLKRHSPNEYGTCAILAYMTAPTVE